MGIDRGSGAARLGRVLGSSGQDGLGPGDGWTGPGPSTGNGGPDDLGPGRHAVLEPAVRASGWRVMGVPVGAAALALVAAVTAGVLLLGGGDGSGEVLVGSADASTTRDAAPVAVEPTDAAPGDEGAIDVPVPVAMPVPVPVPDGSGAAPPDPAGPLVVHVDGAVSRPGVVNVPAGARVSDAVEAAGGVTPDADTRLVNLARLLTDGELVVVPLPGEVPPAGGPAAGGPGAGGAGTSAGEGTPGAPLDLNAADAAALDALPGIGPVLAERIVAHREDVGPFASVDDLESVSGIGPAVLAGIRDQVTV